MLMLLLLVLLLFPGSHDILKPYDSDGMAAQLYFTADAPTSRFFQSWDLDLVFDVLQVGRHSCTTCQQCLLCHKPLGSDAEV